MLYLAENGFNTISIEPGMKCVTDAKERADERAAKVHESGGSFYPVRGAIGTLPYLPLADKIADILIFNGVLHNIPSEYQKEVLYEISRVMKKGATEHFSSHGDFGRPLPEDGGMNPLTCNDIISYHWQAGLDLKEELSKRETSSGLGFMWKGFFEKA